MKIELHHSLYLGAVLVVCSTYNMASANTLQVCSSCSHTTIQGAVDAAASGDVINIAAGTYSENVTIQSKSLSLTGAGNSPGTATLVVASGRGPVFTLGSGTAGDTNQLISISGLTISGGNHQSGTAEGGGIQVRAGSYLHLANSIITQSYAIWGGGISVDSTGAPTTTITNCLISDNVTPGPPLTGVGLGGGVFVQEGSTVAIDQSTISRNTSKGGGGIYSSQGSMITITNTTVSGNVTTDYSILHEGPANGDGAGMETQGDFTISDSFFVNNYVNGGTNGGGGLEIALYDNGPHSVTRTTIAHNNITTYDGSPGHGGGILAYPYSSGTWTLDHSYVEQNLAGYGVYTYSDANPVITNSVISDNVGGNLCIADSNGTCQ